MNFKKSQSGRSMVEMLGVLAIIGVLSVGGIAGYSLSMRRHRANQIADLASKYALVNYNICQQKLMNKEVSSVTECGSMISLSDAGVGNKPAGVGHITHSQIETDTTTGVDTVIVSASFDDDKLCQSVASIAGSTCNKNDGNIVLFYIKQN